jgi:hypothetical protein
MFEANIRVPEPTTEVDRASERGCDDLSGILQLHPGQQAFSHSNITAGDAERSNTWMNLPVEISWCAVNFLSEVFQSIPSFSDLDQ